MNSGPSAMPVFSVFVNMPIGALLKDMDISQISSNHMPWIVF